MRDDKTDELQTQIQYKLIERLSNSQQRQAKLLSLLDECIFECGIDFKLTYVNPAWTQQLGFNHQELIGKTLTSMTPEFSLSSLQANLNIVNAEENAPQRIELQLQTKTGDLRWFELRVVKSGHEQLIGSLFDIQIHKEMESELRFKEEETRKLSLVASHTNNMVIITDSSGCIEWVNNSFEEITGHRMKDVKGRKPGSILQGEQTDLTVVAKMAKAIEAKQPFNVEIVNYNKKGQAYWVAIDASPVKNEDDEITHFIAIESDISQRVRAEQLASEAENNYRIVVDNINEVILRLQPDGNILFMNHAWEKLIQLNENQCLDLPITQFVSDSHQQEIVDALEDFRFGNRTICRLELQMLRGDGSSTWVEMTMTPVEYSQSSDLTAIAATIVNVDNRVLAAQNLKNAKKQAEGLAEDRSRFLANISHEIRTPLNAMIGSSEILQNTGLNQEQQRFAEMIQSSGSALLSILDDVLTYSRFEAGAVTLEHRQFDLGACIDEAIDIVAENALEKNIDLILNLSASTPLNLIGDNVRLRQVMINLLANAIKFTDSGHVLIQVDYEQQADNKPILKVSIEDTGIGIADNKVSQLFVPFMQSDISTTRQYGGSGLGLAICHQICEAAGGCIGVHSKLDVGSTFSFQFPVEIDLDNPHQPLRHLPNNKNSKVWIVGQAKRLNDAIIQVLQRYKIQFEQFENVEHLPNLSENVVDFIVITDPALTIQCRKTIQVDSTLDTPPCLVTMDVLGKSKCIQTISNNELLVNGPLKASHFSRILEQLHEMLGKASIDLTKDNNTSSLHNVQFHNANILVVEDNRQNQIIMEQFLQLCGCNAIIAEHGVAALKKLQMDQIDIVLMDIQMPVMDGITTTRHIRSSDSHFQHVPIIAVTADAVYGDRERYLSSGMNDYISKPIFRAELYELLDKYMPVEKKYISETTKIQRLVNMHELVNNILS